MKKKLDQNTKKSNTRWSEEEIRFIEVWYGAVKTDSIAAALDRTNIAIWQQCKIQGFKLNSRIYAQHQIETIFNGKVYQMQAFRYTRKENGATVDKTIIRKPLGRPRKKTNLEEKEPMAAHRRKPEFKAKKANNKEQEARIQEFKPEGKTLVQIDKKTWVYR